MAERAELPAIDQPTLAEALTNYFACPVEAVPVWQVAPLRRGSGIASTGPFLVSGQATVQGTTKDWTMVLKIVRPPVGSRYDREARVASHWAYWRREPLAYASAVLKHLQGLAAPRCYGIVENANEERILLWLEAVQGANVALDVSRVQAVARALGQFNGAAAPVDGAMEMEWLARQALRSRMERMALEQAPHGFAERTLWRHSAIQHWLPSGFEAAVAYLWERRIELLDGLDALPHTIVHGDANPENILLPQRHTIEAPPIGLDWSNLGVAALGTDLADHVVWSYLTGGASTANYPIDSAVDAYCAGLSDVGYACTRADVVMGFNASAALMAAARLHWLVTRDLRMRAAPSTFEKWRAATTVICTLAGELARSL